jgi:hypothetical protein
VAVNQTAVVGCFWENGASEETVVHMLLQRCVHSGNRQDCASLLRPCSHDQLLELLIEIGKAAEQNEFAWAQSVFFERNFLHQEKMVELDTTRADIRSMLGEIDSVAYEEVKRRSEARWHDG